MITLGSFFPLSRKRRMQGCLSGYGIDCSSYNACACIWAYIPYMGLPYLGSMSLGCTFEVAQGISEYGSFPKLGVPLVVPIRRITVFWGLYCGPLILGNFHTWKTFMFRRAFLVQLDYQKTLYHGVIKSACAIRSSFF